MPISALIRRQRNSSPWTVSSCSPATCGQRSTYRSLRLTRGRPARRRNQQLFSATGGVSAPCSTKLLKPSCAGSAEGEAIPPQEIVAIAEGHHLVLQLGARVFPGLSCPCSDCRPLDSRPARAAGHSIVSRRPVARFGNFSRTTDTTSGRLRLSPEDSLRLKFTETTLSTRSGRFIICNLGICN